MVIDEKIENLENNLNVCLKDEVVVVKAGSSVLPDNDSYHAFALQLIEVLNIYDIEQLIVVCSARKNETESVIENIAGNKKELLIGGLHGDRADEFDNYEVAQKLVFPEIVATYRLRNAVVDCGYDDVSVLVQNNLMYPIVANYSKLKATVDLEASIKNRDYVSSLSRLVIASGFGAIDKTKRIVCLGKGSSDDVAIIFGEIMRARRVVLLKDQLGVYDGFGTKDAMKLDNVSCKYAKNLGKVINSSVFDISSNVELRVGHYGEILSLVGGLDNYGTIVFRS